MDEDFDHLEAEFCEDPLEHRVRQYINNLPDMSDFQVSLSELSYSLCQKLRRSSGMPASALARELRMTLELINQEAAPNDDDGFLDGLSTPVHGGGGPDLPPAVGNSKES